MNIKATNRDVMWSYIGTFFSMISNFILLPVIMLFLTDNEIGLWYIFLSINGLVILFDFGFDPTFARNVAYVWSGAKELKKSGTYYNNSGEPNYHLLKEVIEVCKLLYKRISGLAFICAITFGTAYIMYISKEITGIMHLVAWIIFCISIYLNMYMGYYSALLRGVGAISRINKALVISRMVQLLVASMCLVLGMGLVSVSIGFLVNGLVLRALCKKFFYQYQGIQNGLDSDPHPVDKKVIKKLLGVISYNAFRDGVVALSNYMMTQGSTIIASLFLSLGETGIYSISLQLTTAVATAASAIISAYHPTLQSAFAVKNIDKERLYISKGLVAFYILYFLGTIGVIFVVFPVLHLLKPTFLFSTIVYVGMSIYMFLWQQQSIAASYISNTNDIPYVKSFLYSSVVGVIFAYLLTKYSTLGIWGIILGLGFVQLLYNNWKWLLVVFKRVDLNLFKVIENGLKAWVGKYKF